MRAFILATALLLGAGATVAQMPAAPPGKAEPSRIVAGTYKVDPSHSQVLFGVDHLGFNPYYGHFSDISGTLTIDPAKPVAAAVDISIPIASVRTTSTKLDEELVSPQFFDAARFPTMRFKSTKVEVDGLRARVTGDLTLHGVTRSVVMEALFHGAGVSPMRKATTVGFDGRAAIKRSDFGVTYGVPIVSDEVSIIITVAFEKAAG